MAIPESSTLSEVAIGADSVTLTIDAAAALSPFLVATLRTACDRAEDAPAGTPFVVHLRGTSEQIRDIPWPGDNVSIQLATSWERSLRRLERISSPLICLVEHLCGGLALEILLCCDFRVATPNMRVHRGPVARQWPGMLVYRLAKELGAARARSILLCTEELSASDAVAIGLVDLVSPHLHTELAHELPARMRGLLDPSVPLFRQLLSESFATPYEDALGLHLASCEKIIRSRCGT